MGLSRITVAAAGAALLVAACSPGSAPSTTLETQSSTTSRPTTTSSTTSPPELALDPQGSYAVVAFSNHLPAYGVTADGAPDRPWARLHTTRDYITMTRLLADSSAKLVLGFSPALLTAIAETAAGNWDEAALLTLKPAAELTPEDKAYIDNVFLTASPDQIERFPRYRELADRRAAGRTLATSEYRDLQALFNLAWSSPLLLEQEPLLSLAAKGRSFTADDKQVILDTHRAVLGEFLESLLELQESGQIELAASPLYNPILPLLVRNRMDQDAADQISRGAEAIAAVLGSTPAGFMPELGLIDQSNTDAVTGNGYEWVILRDTDVPAPRRLTSEGGELLALPADGTFGDELARRYFDMDPNAAALETIQHISQAVGDVPGGVITISADGSEPWGRYADSGVAYLRSLMRQLEQASSFTTALPSDLRSAIGFAAGPFPELPTSYLSEPNELAAWAHLGETRRQLLRAREVGAVSEQNLEEAYDLVMQSQDAAWYWWFGNERASGDDPYYDALFRTKLADVWELLGSPRPEWADVALYETSPLTPLRVNAPRATAIDINNSISDVEWSSAGRYEEQGSELVRRVFYTLDADNLYLRVDFTTEVLGDSAPGFDLYLGGPNAAGAALSPAGIPLDFEADRVLRWRGTDPVGVSAVERFPGPQTSTTRSIAGFDGNSIEFAIARDEIDAELRPGDLIDFRIVDVTGGPERGAWPASGRGAFQIPNFETGNELARIADLTRDDYGPGTYNYVVDSEVGQGTYDLAGLTVRQIGKPTELNLEASSQIQFEITFREPLTNPWSAPAGFSHQTIDVYIDVDPANRAGSRRLLPGRVAATEGNRGWDYAFSIDGWGGSQYIANAAGDTAEISGGIEYTVLRDGRTVLVTVDRELIPAGDETQWRYGVAVLANQAIPSLGVHELRTLSTVAARFRLGGATGAVNDPMIMDLLHPDVGVQEELLTYPGPVAIGDPETIAIDRLARVPLIANAPG